tara:strand:- start:707 stop:1228 length:522 start_codon:yes stop_codon:yes gene_type:complete
MKNIILGLIVLVLVGCSEKRVLYNKITKNGEYFYYEGELFNGIGFDVYDDGKLLNEGNIKEGKLDGLVKGWYGNGQLEYEYNFKDGKRDGKLKKWYEDGRVMYETEFVNGNGVDRYFYNGQLFWEINYIDGKKNGLQKDWYTNGQLKSEMNYKNDLIISEKCWDEEGDEKECP